MRRPSRRPRASSMRPAMSKQQLENQIDLLQEQIHSAHMNDEHYDQRAKTIETELLDREGQLAGRAEGTGRDQRGTGEEAGPGESGKRRTDHSPDQDRHPEAASMDKQ